MARVLRKIMRYRSQEYLSGYEDCMREWLRANHWILGRGYSFNQRINTFLKDFAKRVLSDHLDD